MRSGSGSNLARMAAYPPIRLGILGCGRVAEACHLPALQGLAREVEVVAAVDADEHRLRRVAGMFEIAEQLTSLEQLLGHGPSVDAVAVCVPASAHADAVVTSIEAGKHVLVEKPLALTLEDADRIAAAAARSDRALMVGFNLRHHPLVEQAKRMVAGGLLGDIHLVRTVWTSAIRSRMKLPAWRSRRQSGGGVLSEIAVHHVDLVRHLTGAEIAEVLASSRHGESDDEVAALTLRLDNGAVVTSGFSELSGDANELELVGSKGRLAFSLYRFDSLHFTPTGTHGARAAQLLETLRQLPQAIPVLRRGGDFPESYRREWLAFVDAVRKRCQPTATVADGRAALRVVLAAGASANLGRPVKIDHAPREPQAVAGRETAIVIEPSAAHANLPALSAIIATPGAFDSIRRTVRHLRAQTVRERIELLIVCASERTLMLDTSAVEGFWGHRVVEIGPFETVAVANTAGVRAAAAPVVVLCEDHAFPDPNWAESLVIAHRGPYAAVGPAIHNANPDTLVSRADCLIGYGPWLEPIKPCEPEHLPGHNSAYKRDVLLGYGERLGDMMEAETVLQWDLRSKGHRLYLDPSARLAHTNFAQLGIWTSVQFHAARVFAATRALAWPRWKRLLYTLGSPAIPLVRLRRIWAHSRRLGASERIGPALLLVLLWGLALDGIGQMVGYLASAGGSKRVAHDFDRVAHITESDRQKLEAAERASLPSSVS